MTWLNDAAVEIENRAIRGLRALLDSNTLSSLEMPPENATEAEYDAWWVANNTWKSSHDNTASVADWGALDLKDQP